MRNYSVVFFVSYCLNFTIAFIKCDSITFFSRINFRLFRIIFPKTKRKKLLRRNHPLKRLLNCSAPENRNHLWRNNDNGNGWLVGWNFVYVVFFFIQQIVKLHHCGRDQCHQHFGSNETDAGSVFLINKIKKKKKTEDNNKEWLLSKINCFSIKQTFPYTFTIYWIKCIKVFWIVIFFFKWNTWYIDVQILKFK